MSTCLSFRDVDYRSFEAVEIQLSLDHLSVVVFLCLYRPTPGKRSNLTNSMFLEEFPELLFQYTDSGRDVVYLGDFDFHYDDSSDGQVSGLKTLLSDHSLTQIVNVPTHKCGHLLDCVVVRFDSSCLSFEGVQDYHDLSDHKAADRTLAVAKPSTRRRLVTSRNIRSK